LNNSSRAKGPPPQVLAIKPQKVEGVRDWFPFSAEQLVEPAHALRIDADNLAVRKLLYHDPRTSAVVPQTHEQTQGNNITSEARGWEPQVDTGPARGRICEHPPYLWQFRPLK